MRAMIIALAALVAMAIGPRVELDGAFVSAVDVPAPVVTASPGNVGDFALTFVARPRAEPIAILPDIPGKILDLEADALPLVDAAPAQLALVLARPPANDRAADPEPAVDLLRSAGKFLTPPNRSADAARITGNRLALRTGPARRFPSVLALNAGDQVRITGDREGGYVPVTSANGTSGWVFHSYVTRIE
ncbi:MAG: SH3 domain-containing protein [Pseudomonadota bacterium]